MAHRTSLPVRAGSLARRVLHRSAAASLVALLAAGLGACLYDFDAHFSGGTEDCANGVDDDDNGLVDCADPACAAFVCAPAVPSGWIGPVVIVVATSGGAVCPSGWEPAISGPSCSACTCSGGGCGAPQVNLFQSGCAGGADDVELIDTPAQCEAASVSGGTHDAQGTAPTPNGTCAASGGEPVTTALCVAPRGGGCGERFCSPASAGPLCVYQNGDVMACPDAFPSRGAVLAPKLPASAACEACSCGPVHGSCSGTTHLFSNGDCTGTDTAVPHDGKACVPFPDQPQSLRYDPAPPNVICDPSGGAPAGAQDGDLVTVCCAGPS